MNEAKRVANIAKHDVDFKLVREFDFENAMEVEQLALSLTKCMLWSIQKEAK